MAINFIWYTDNVDIKTKELFEVNIENNILSALEVPKELQDKDINVTIQKNPNEPDKSYSVVGVIETQDEEFIARYQLKTNPNNPSGFVSQQIFYEKLPQS